MYGARILSRIRDLAANTRGNVAIAFALATLPIISLVGAGIDYARAASAKARLNGFADAAVLEAVSNGMLRNVWNMPDYGQASTRSLFVSKAQTISDLSLDSIEVNIQQSSTNRSVTLTYTAQLPNYFSAYLNKSTTTLSGRATSAVSMPVYMDFYLMLDNSPSMGLGATLADIRTMESNAGCAFACHESDKPGADLYALAKRLGVTMRVDVVRQATQRLIDTAAATQAVPNQFRVGIYTFSDTLQQVSPLTTDFQAAKTAAGAIDLKVVPYQNFNDDRFTNFDGFIPSVAYLPYGGTGTSSASPKAVLFLVSDGLADEPTPGNPSGRTLKPIPQALCDQIKSRNIQIAALYTTYYLPNEQWSRDNIGPLLPQVGPAMQQCASPGLYFEVSPSQGISDAMQALFQKAVGMARLAQ